MSTDSNNDEDFFNQSPRKKSLEQLVEEGTISPRELKSFLLLMQTGVGFSSYPDDAIYIQKKTKELNEQLSKNSETPPTKKSDEYNLERFINAQGSNYDEILSELRSGKKQSHWMWFIFPQLDGLGRSDTTKFYAIKSIEEARQYLSHPILGERLIECTKMILADKNKSITSILGKPDDIKLKSSMTLFSYIVNADSVFDQTLKKYFDGELDQKTIKILKESS